MRRDPFPRRTAHPPLLFLLLVVSLVAGSILWGQGPMVLLATEEGERTLPLETYVCGVLAAEMPAAAPTAALEALAVAARTYALYHHLQLVDSTAEELYRPPQELPGGRMGRVCGAAKATAGLYLSYDGAPALTVFSADAGPWSESSRRALGAPLPYLPAHPDPFGVGAPIWHAVFFVPSSRLRALTGSGTPRLKRDRAGHVLEIGRLSGQAFARALDLPSTDFTLRAEGAVVRIDTYGDGHGVGLDEWGAIRMAEEGASYLRILSFYYPGTELASLGGG